jgi:integrase
MAKKPLTAVAVKSAQPGAVRREIPDGASPGLYLVVQPSGAKSWALRYRFGDKTRKLTLGEAGETKMTLADARDAAHKAKLQVEAGRDPANVAKPSAKADQKVRKSLTPESPIDDVVEAFVAQHVANKRDSTAAEMKRLLDRHILGILPRKDAPVLPSWKGLQIRAVTKADVLSIMDPAIEDGKPYLANRIFAMARKLLNWCVQRDLIPVSPAKGISPPGEEQTRERVLTGAEMGALWKACESIGYPWGTLAKILLLTGQRREEVAGMRWSELDLTSKAPEWAIPRERAKNNVAHTVPLSPLVVSILSGVEKVDESDFVLTSTGAASVSGFSKGKIIIDRAMLAELRKGNDAAELTNWRLHDLRRTAVSGMAALGHPVQVVEAVINHKSGSVSGVAAVYNRHDYAAEKRKALYAWSRSVTDILDRKKQSGATLIELKNFRA